jgi:predicted amidohydrolase
MTLAIVSLNQIWKNKEENLLLCEEYIKKASNENVDLIIFPEMTLTGFSINISLTAENKENSETINKFKKMSKYYNIAILFGLVIKDNEKALNKSMFINNHGKI